MAIKFVDVTSGSSPKTAKPKEAAKPASKSETAAEEQAPGLAFEKPAAANARKAAANGEAPEQGKAQQKFGNKKKG